MASNFQRSSSTGDFERRPELSQLRVASSFLIVWAWHSEDVAANLSKVRLLRSSENIVLHYCLAVCSRSFFSRLISTRVPLVRLATRALPIPIT